MPAKKKTKRKLLDAAERFVAPKEGTVIRKATPAELEILKRLHAGERPTNTNEQ